MVIVANMAAANGDGCLFPHHGFASLFPAARAFHFSALLGHIADKAGALFGQRDASH
jgi:hypothetical protein